MLTSSGGGCREDAVPTAATSRRTGTIDHPASREAYFGPGTGWLETPILARPNLENGVKGPCIVEEYDSTCLIPPGAGAELDAGGNILIDLSAR